MFNAVTFLNGLTLPDTPGAAPCCPTANRPAAPGLLDGANRPGVSGLARDTEPALSGLDLPPIRDGDGPDSSPVWLELDAVDRLVIDVVEGRLPGWSYPAAPSVPGVPDGWTLDGWLGRLRHLADACQAVNPNRAAELRREAARLDAEIPLACRQRV